MPHVPGSSDSPISSSSASFGDGAGGGGNGGGSSPPNAPSGGTTPHPHAVVSVGIGSNRLGFTTEKDVVYRSKDLSLIKVENLPIPTSAAECPGWKNTFPTRVASIDQTGNDIILA